LLKTTVSEPPVGRLKNKNKEHANDANSIIVAIQPEACPNFLPNKPLIIKPINGSKGINIVGINKFDVCITVSVIFKFLV
jgi:glutathione synthase/RimK-type ligase-like ATP-grasp enzyme